MKATVRSRNSAYRYVDSVCNTLGERFDPHTIEMAPVKSVRSLEQNNYLFGVCYQTILTEGGEELAGWTKNDLHDFFLIDHFGSEVIEGFGMKRHKPLSRSSKLSKVDFSAFISHIHQFASEHGIYIPDPEER